MAIPDTTGVLNALVELKTALIAVQDFKEGPEFEWQSICDAVDRVRACLSVTDHLAAAVPPADVRRLQDLLDEIARMYHLDDPNTAIVGPVDKRIIKSLTNQIWLFGESKTQPRRTSEHISAQKSAATVNHETREQVLLKEISRFCGGKPTVKTMQNRTTQESVTDPMPKEISRSSKSELIFEYAEFRPWFQRQWPEHQLPETYAEFKEELSRMSHD